MADGGAASFDEGHTSTDVSKLKRDLEGYREILLPINKVLEWDQNYYPAIVAGVITFVFAVIWYLEPSVLTTVCLLGVLVCVVDFALPTINSVIFAKTEWTVVQDRQFEAICVRITHAKQHVNNIIKYMTSLKKEKPKAYLVVLIGTFAILAWLGSLIDNLLLTYLIVLILAMIPGLRKRGILQVLTDKVGKLLEGVKKSAQEKAGAKPKSN